jgi:hypothetical protein
MAQYRKKPVVIEAQQLTRRFADVAVEFVPKEIRGDFNLGEFHEDSCYLEIKTLEGTMTANEGDYIIKGIKGEFYPCKPDIFEATYEKI